MNKILFLIFLNHFCKLNFSMNLSVSFNNYWKKSYFLILPKPVIFLHQFVYLLSFQIFCHWSLQKLSKYASDWEVYHRAHCFWWKPNCPFDSPLFFYSMMMCHLLFILVFFKNCHHWFFSSILPPNINPMWLSDQLTLGKLIAKWVGKLIYLTLLIHSMFSLHSFIP